MLQRMNRLAGSKTHRRAVQVMKDVDRIINKVISLRPDVASQQLRARHSADDDGLWLFNAPDARNTVQIESSNGMCPFLIENDITEERHRGATVDDVVHKVLEWLSL